MQPGDGYTWSRQLVFRAKVIKCLNNVNKHLKMLFPPQLTSHTAFKRSDNTEPGAVTSLAVSRDHRWGRSNVRQRKH